MQVDNSTAWFHITLQVVFFVLVSITLHLIHNNDSNKNLILQHYYYYYCSLHILDEFVFLDEQFICESG